MKRSRKIMLGVLDILLVAISSEIGFGLIAGGPVYDGIHIYDYYSDSDA